MAEGGISLSEIRPSPGSQTPRETKPQVPPESPQTAKRSLTDRLRGVVLRMASEREFQEEDFTEMAIANDVLKYMRNPVREFLGDDPHANPFDKRDVLSNIGHTRSMGNPDSQAYRAASQSLEALVRKGALAGEYGDAKHGETRYYTVQDIERLRKIASGELGEV